MRARHILALALVVAWSGSATAIAAATAEDRQEIVGGQPTDGDLPVVALLDADGASFCTGSVIAPRVILTAAHCVTGSRVADRVFLGSDVAGPGLELAIAWTEAHPSYDPASLEADVALLWLVADVDAAHLSSSRAPLSEAFVGQELRFVGFGYDRYPPGEGVGTKRHVTQPVLAIEGDTFTYARATCHGDSGGPALARDRDGKETIVGIVSSGVPGCRGYGRATRVDVYASWIAERVRASEPPGGCSVVAPESLGGALLLWLWIVVGSRQASTTREDEADR